MGFFTNRERRELNPETNKRPVDGRGLRDFAPARLERKVENAPDENDPGALLQSAARAQVHEIDALISDLQMMRDRLSSEASRVQRAMVAYATFSETASQSSKVICESLRSGMQPFQEKYSRAKATRRAHRKAARRLARMAKKADRAELQAAKREAQGS